MTSLQKMEIYQPPKKLQSFRHLILRTNTTTKNGLEILTITESRTSQSAAVVNVTVMPQDALMIRILVKLCAFAGIILRGRIVGSVRNFIMISLGGRQRKRVLISVRPVAATSTPSNAA